MKNQDKPENKINPVVDQPVHRRKGNIQKQPAEIGGPKGPEPTRYGDWERRGRCIDF